MKKGDFSPTREYLEDAYYNKKMTYKDIAKENGVNPVAVHYWFKKYGLTARMQNKIMHPHCYTIEELQKISKRHKGKTVNQSTRNKISEANKLNSEGHKKIGKDGYVKVYFPIHPHATKDGYVKEHRLVMEKYIGRYLTCDEVVHHKNRNKTDNRIENLELMTKSEHMSMHMKERKRK